MTNYFGKDIHDNISKVISSYNFVNCFPFLPQGWSVLLVKMLNEVKASLDKIDAVDVEILDIKEKYGLLKVYFNVYDEELQKIAKKYEAMSDKICMSCGAPMYKSGIRNDSCINLCEDCLEERKSELREYNFYAVSDRNIYTYEDEEGYVTIDITKDWEKYLAEYNQWKKHNTPSCPETEKVLEGI